MSNELVQIEETLSKESLSFALPGAWAQYNLGEDQWQYYKHLEAMEDKLLDVFEGKTNRLMISCPSQYGKTQLVTKAFSSWYLGRKPNTRVIITSYDTDFAASIGGESRDWLELSGAEVFGITVDDSQHSKKDWSVVDVNNPERRLQGNLRAIGVGAGIAGKPCDLLIVEDTIKTNTQAMSKSYLDMLSTWWADDIEGRIVPTTKIVVVQTRRSVRDLIGLLLEKEKQGGDQWEKLFLPELAEPNDPLGREEGEPLWPELRPLEWCIQKKANMTQLFWSANRQCRPTEIGGNVIKLAWFRRYKEIPERHKVESIVLSVDTASTKTEISDYCVVQVWFVMENSRYYLVDQVREKMDHPELIRTVIEVADGWKPHGILIENKGSGTSLIQHLEQETEFSPITFNPVGDKEMRAINESHSIKSGHVYLPEEGSQPWLYDFEAEVGAFPAARFDDQVDALSMFLCWAREQRLNRIELW